MSERSAIPAAVSSWGSGGFVLIVLGIGSAFRANLALAAEFATVEALDTMLSAARGVLALTLDAGRFDVIGLQATDVSDDLTNPRARAATATVRRADPSASTESLEELTATIAAVVHAGDREHGLVQPGRLPILRSRRHECADPPGPIEAADELARLAGTRRSALLSEVIDEAGDLADAPYVANLGSLLRIPLVRVEALLPSLHVSDAPY